MSETITDPYMSKEEYQRALATEEFIHELTLREEDVERMKSRSYLCTTDDGDLIIKRKARKKYNTYISETVTIIDENAEMADIADNPISWGVPADAKWYADGWPGQRAHKIARALTKLVPEIELDLSAYDKYKEMRDFADELNDARNTVISGGDAKEEQRRQERKKRKLSGDNLIGPSRYSSSHQLGFMACGAGRKYDIKGGVAMRARTSIRPDINGNIRWGSASEDTPYTPFPDKDQEAAIRMIRALGKKQIDRDFELQRAIEVKEAKAKLGIAGIKIPKPRVDEPALKEVSNH